MPNQYLLAKDTINGAEGTVVITHNGNNYVAAGMRNIRATVDIQSEDMRVIGTRKIQDKPNGAKQTGTGNVYYGNSMFTEMVLNYANNGIAEDFDIQLTNDDPTTSVGRQVVALYGCHLTGEIPIAILDSEETMLNYDYNFAYTRAAVIQSFNAPAQLGS